MNEFLITEMNRMCTTVFDFYGFHNTPKNYYYIEMGIYDLRKNIEKKMNLELFANNMATFSKNFRIAAETSFKFATKEELEHNLKIVPNFNTVIDRMVFELQKGLLGKSFQEEFNDALNQIFKSDQVYDEELRFELRRYFRIESERLEVQIRDYLNKFILQMKQYWNNQLEEQVNKTRLELEKYEENKTEEFGTAELIRKIDAKIAELDKEAKEEEKNKKTFIAEREKQREQDKIDRSKQIAARNMVYNNEEYQLEEKGKSL